MPSSLVSGGEQLRYWYAFYTHSSSPRACVGGRQLWRCFACTSLRRRCTTTCPLISTQVRSVATDPAPASATELATSAIATDCTELATSAIATDRTELATSAIATDCTELAMPRHVLAVSPCHCPNLPLCHCPHRVLLMPLPSPCPRLPMPRRVLAADCMPVEFFQFCVLPTCCIRRSQRARNIRSVR